MHVAESSRKLTLFMEKSWKKFETYSLRRNDHIWLTMMNHWKEGPKGGYHRQCYHTNVGNISKIKETTDKAVPASANHEIAADEPSKEPPAKRYHRSHVQRFDIDKFIICQVEVQGNEVKGSSTLEYQRVWQCIPSQSSRDKGDNRVLLQIKGQDCIACEIKYHRSCYKNYVRLDTLTKLKTVPLKIRNLEDTEQRLANCVIIFKVKSLLKQESST